MQNDKPKIPRNEKQASDTGSKDKNAGSGGFNQGAEQEPNMNEGVEDGTPDPDEVSQEKENPKSGKVG